LAFVANTGSLTLGVTLGGYTNGSTPDVFIPAYSSKAIPFPGGYNGPIGAKNSTAATGGATYSELGGQPVGYIGNVSWRSKATTLMVGSNVTAGVTLSAAKSNGQHRTYITISNTNAFNVGLKFAGTYVLANTADVTIFSNTSFGVQFPVPYDGAITVRALNTNDPVSCYLPNGEWGY
jgi:hypothetical protein